MNLLLRVWNWFVQSWLALILLGVLSYVGYVNFVDIDASRVLEVEATPTYWFLKPWILDRVALLPEIGNDELTAAGPNDFRDTSIPHMQVGIYVAGRSSALYRVNGFSVEHARPMTDVCKRDVPPRHEEHFAYVFRSGLQRALLDSSGQRIYSVTGALLSDTPARGESCKGRLFEIEGERLLELQASSKTLVPDVPDGIRAVYNWEDGEECRAVAVTRDSALEAHWRESTGAIQWKKPYQEARCGKQTWAIQGAELHKNGRAVTDLPIARAWTAVMMTWEEQPPSGGCDGILLGSDGAILRYYNERWVDLTRSGREPKRWLPVRWLPSPVALAIFVFSFVAIGVRVRRWRRSRIARRQQPEPADRPTEKPIPDANGTDAVIFPEHPKRIFGMVWPALVAAIVVALLSVVSLFSPLQSVAYHSSTEDHMWLGQIRGPYPVDQDITAVHTTESVDPMYDFVIAGGSRGSVFVSANRGATWERDEAYTEAYPRGTRLPALIPSVIAVQYLAPRNVAPPDSWEFLKSGHRRAGGFHELRAVYSDGTVVTRSGDSDNWQLAFGKDSRLPSDNALQRAGASFLLCRSCPFVQTKDNSGKLLVFDESGWSAGEALRHEERGVEPDNGTFIATSDSARHPDLQNAPRDVALWADDRNSRGPVLHAMLVRRDGPIAGPARIAPGWAGLLILAMLAVLVFGLKLRPLKPLVKFHRHEVEGISVAGLSDSPVDSPYDDFLGFSNDVRAVAAHIMDESTTLPICFSIEGDWGTGKTSYMQLLRRQLQERGCRTVWVNPWHHHAEESILAAVLDAAQRHGVPSAFSRSGLAYRGRLILKRRGWAYLVSTAVAVFVAFHPASVLELLKRFNLGQGYTSDASMWVQVFSGSAGLISADRLRRIWKILRINLGASFLIGDGVSGKELAARLSLRHRAAGDLSESLAALRPSRLVVFLDDLDRCGPRELMTCLEVCNFLASCGPVVTVLGMSRSKVEAILQSELASTARTLKVTPQFYCREFLKKIIQQPVVLQRRTPDFKRVVSMPFAILPQQLPANVTTSQMLSHSWKSIQQAPGFLRWSDRVSMAGSLVIEAGVIGVLIVVLWYGWPGFQMVSPNAHVLKVPLDPRNAFFASLVVWITLRLCLRAMFLPTIYRDGTAYETTAHRWAEFVWTRTGSLRSVKRIIGRARFYASKQRQPLSDGWIRNAVGYAALEECLPPRETRPQTRLADSGG